MKNKLVADFLSGKLEVTGSEELVKFIYEDFKSQLGKSNTTVKNVAEFQPKVDGLPPKPTPKSVKSPRKKGKASIEVDTSLDLAKLPSYFAEFDVKKDAERALIFAVFLQDELSLNPFTASALYSCFFALQGKLKLPNVESLLANDKARTKFFERQGDGQINITTVGRNHFNLKISEPKVT